MKLKSRNTLGLYAALIKGYTVNKKGLLFNPKGVQVGKYINANGYHRASLRINNVKMYLLVHQFVAFCKFGAKVFQTECVRHLDGNPLNNSWSNIALGSHSDNIFDIPREVRLKRSSKTFKKYNHEQVIALSKEGKSYNTIMGITGIKSKSTVNHILKHRFIEFR